MIQTTDTLVMIRPSSFRMNEQTVINNFYQQHLALFPSAINAKAQHEFDHFVNKLRFVGVDVIVIDDTEYPNTPDALFPNNWISFHENGDIGLYPMFAENRRKERRQDILDILEEKNFTIENIIDYSSAEEEGYFLEGTGSMVLDREHKKAYCALSPRSDEELLIEFCEDFEYTPVVFIANQTINGKRQAIYHTNVMMCIAEKFAMICLETIDDKKEKKNILKHLKSDGKEIILITEEQLTQFAGNALQVKGKGNKHYLIMSSSAFNSLNDKQRKVINKYCEIVHSPLETIETCGGGSARCMMAEVFLPKKNL